MSRRAGFHAKDLLDPIVGFFALLAIGLRIFFWAYTGRVWEDALIALASARNFWQGLGLVQHVEAERVYSFSSPLDVLVMLSGEWAGFGLVAVKLTSLFCSAAAIVFASKILRGWAVNRLGEITCLSYLACDHLQIFFGMAGMETQMATALAFAMIWTGMQQRHWLFGLACGLAILARLELALLVLMAFFAIIRKSLDDGEVFPDRFGGLAKAVAGVFLVVLPWLGFTYFYYGTVVPHTIIVKSYTSGGIDVSQAWNHLSGFWRQLSPFYEYWFVVEAPVPDALLKIIVGLLGLYAVYGLMKFLRNPWVVAVGAAVFGFAIYCNIFNIHPYFMWYVPPFLALAFLLVAAGLSNLTRLSRPLAVVSSGGLIIAYAVPLCFTPVLDRLQQQDVDIGVRQAIGKSLAAMMKPDDTVVLESLGYIGLEVRARTVYDFPGLSSKTAFRAIKEKNGWRMIEALQPDFLVLRANELETVSRQMPTLMGGYDQRDHRVADVGYVVSNEGLSYKMYDRDIYIFERKLHQP